jgi:hypothetical protein
MPPHRPVDANPEFQTVVDAASAVRAEAEATMRVTARRIAEIRETRRAGMLARERRWRQGAPAASRPFRPGGR